MRRGRKWIVRILPALGCGLLLAVWFAPVLVSSTTLRQQVPKLLFPTIPGAIEIGSASMDWLSPVIIRNLHWEDADGNPLLDINEFATSQPLWKLVTRRSNLGRLRIVEPYLAVSVRSDGSNLEDVINELLSGPASTSPVPEFELEVVGRDDHTGTQAGVTEFDH